MITLNAIEIKHERRLRLLFSRPVAAGAFGVLPSLYVVTCTDASGANPVVNAAMIVSSNPAVVELALSVDLVQSGAYSVSAVGVPGDDASVTPEGTVLPFRFGLNAPHVNAEPVRSDNEGLLYGIDLLWNGVDYQETANGDLEQVSGTANVTKALYRIIESNGLPWDPSFGAHAREFVDSPSPAGGTLKGVVSAQILKDPRVKSIKVDISQDDEKTYLTIKPTLITGADIKPVTMTVPSSG